jgi:3-methyladenine DNA glycosylase AlkD
LALSRKWEGALLFDAVVDVAKLARRIEADLKKGGNPKRAEGEKSYLKSDLRFFGASLAHIRSVAKSVTRNGQLEHDDLVGLVEDLWSKPVFERRMTAVVLLDLHAAELGSRDLTVIEKLIRESNTWALVDGLAVDVVGGIALRHRIKQKLDKWAKDDDFWVRRSSLLAELKPLKNGADFNPFAARADALLDETEFFIRKAIGWVLRETSKERPQEVYEWIAPRTHRASGVTMREAVKYLPVSQASRLMKAYKEGRPARFS